MGEDPAAGTLAAAVAEHHVRFTRVGHRVLAAFGRGCVGVVEAVGIVFVGVRVEVAVAVDGVLGDSDLGAVGKEKTVGEGGAIWCNNLRS